MGKYDGKNVVVTGGTSGIGLATAKLLVAEGARVVVTGMSEKSIEAAQSALGDKASVVKSDASSVGEIDALARRLESEFRTIDALFVCAGQTGFAPFTDTTEALYDKLFAINAKGPYFTIQKLAPLIVSGGAVVVVTSVANVLGIPMISGYAASKAALRSMVRSLAAELLPRGIRVNAVSPGPIDSGILEKAMPEEAAAQTKKQMADENPMKRFGKPDEIARAMLFLAFEATYNTGSELAVDGGGTQL